MKKILKDINPFSNKKVDNKGLYLIKIVLTTYLIYFVSLILAEAIIIGISFLFGYNATDNQLPYDIMLLSSYYGYLITIILFILFTKKVNKIKLNKIGLDKNIKTFFKGLLFGIITLVSIICILILFKAIKFNGINNNINYLFLILFLFGFLIQSMMEELICRGYLFHRLKEKLPLETSIIFSIIIFSVGHFSKLFDKGFLLGIIGIVNLLLISLIWISTTIKDKNIYNAIGFHFIWNFTLFNIIGLNLSGIEVTNSLFKFKAINTFLTGSTYGIESSIITTVILTIVLILIKKYYNKVGDSNEKNTKYN